MAHWSMVPSESAAFSRDIIDVQLDCGYPVKAQDGSTLPEAMDRLMAWPFYDKLVNFLTRADAVENFQNWLLHRYIGGAKIPGMMRFEVSITYKLPPLAAAASVTFGCQAVLPSANPDLRDRAYEWLTLQCNEAFTQYMTSSGTKPALGVTNGSSGDFLVLSLVHTFDKGDHVYKAKGGPFVQHGLRIYPEALAAAGIDAEKLPMGETAPKMKWRATILLNKDGKPYKVGELVKANDDTH